MSFEAPRRTAPPEKEGNGEDARASYLKEKKWRAAIAERASRVARAGVLASLLLQAPSGERTPAPDLVETASSGVVEVADGEKLAIPIAGSYFNDVKVFLPKKGPPAQVVILFKQIHESPYMSQDSSLLKRDARTAMLNEMVENQAAIYKDLKELAEQRSISKVCSEGVLDSDDIAKDEADVREVGTAVTADIVTDYLPDSDLGQAVKQAHELAAEHKFGSEYDRASSTVEHLMKTSFAQYKYAIGAAELLAGEGVLHLCPGASKKTYDALFDNEKIIDESGENESSLSADELAQVQKVVFDDREDAALALAASQGDRAIALEFGASHAFIGALERWNVAHPEHPLGLVSVGQSASGEAP